MTQVPPSVPPAPDPSSQPVVPVCYRHPKRETYVRCSRCDRPICAECMNDAPVGQQCPSCVSEGRRTVRAGRTTFGGTAIGLKGYVTKALIAINTLVMVVSISVGGGRGMFGGGLGGLLGGATPHLNRKHTIFGEVADEESRKVVDAIATTRTAQERPLSDIVINRIDIERS